MKSEPEHSKSARDVGPRQYSATDLFGVPQAEFINFNFLHDIQFPPNDSRIHFEDALLDKVRKELEPIHAVCKGFGYKPLLSEFALITDTRLVGPKVDSYFTSFISCFFPSSSEVLTAYADALQYMGTTNSGTTQIVPHPGLYNPHFGWVQDSIPHIYPKTEADLVIAEPHACIIAIRQPFALVSKPSLSVLQQVDTFINRLVNSFTRTSELSASASLLDGSLFFLLPFVRPGFESSAMPSGTRASPSEYKGYPGGALFLFLKSPDEPREDHGDLMRALSLLLAESSLRESYASFDVEERRSRSIVSYSLTHNLKQRLGSLIASKDLLLDSFATGDTTCAARLRYHAQLVDHVYMFSELAHLLHFAAQNGADGALAAADYDGTLKFSRSGQLDLWKLLTLAIGNVGLRRDISREIKLNSVDKKPAINGFHAMPGFSAPVRLKDEVYLEICYEIVANALRHGLPDAKNCVNADVAIVPIRDYQAVVISNDISENMAQGKLGEPIEDWKEWSGGATGLTFVSDCLRVTGAGRVWIKHCRTADKRLRRFSIALGLRGLTSVD